MTCDFVALFYPPCTWGENAVRASLCIVYVMQLHVMIDMCANIQLSVNGFCGHNYDIGSS